jgi:hypothetical protein
MARLRESLAVMRDHLSRYGTAVGALAGAVLGGVGWATFTSFWPLPAGQGHLVVAIGLASASSLGGAVLLIRRFFAAQRRIVFSLDDFELDGVRRGSDLRGPEAKGARLVLGGMAEEELARTIADLERRRLRLVRSARRHLMAAAAGGPGARRSEAQARLLTAEASRLAKSIELATVQAAVKVLEIRQRQVFRGWATATLSLLTAAGILTLLLIADYSHGERELEKARSACARDLRVLDGYTCDERGVLHEPAGAPMADTDVTERLRECVADVGPSLKGASQDVIDAAVARCAGFDLPGTSADG